MASTDDTAIPATGRDADSWARHTGPLSVGSAPEGALNLNVEGRQLASPMQGFGKLWQKTYRVALDGAELTPAEVITVWKANYGTFWPDGNNFYAPVAGIQPGEVGLINADMPGGMRMSTGVMVLYADDVSFTFMTPLGHPFAGWITFSADDRDGHTSAQVQVLMRATDPASELGLALGGHRTEDRMWEQTLGNLATHVGVSDPQVATVVECIDRHRQWRRAGNIRHDAVLHTAAHLALVPVRAVGMSWRGLQAAATVTNALAQVAIMALAVTLIAPAVVLTAISLVGLAVRRRVERTGAAVIGAVGVVQTLAIAPFALPALVQPSSPVDFLHAIVSLIAGVTMAVAAIALLRGRGGAPRRLALAGAVAMVVGVAIAGVATVATTSDALDPGQIEVVAERNTWAPTGVSATSSSVLYVDNRDLFHHTFTVDALGIDVDLPAATARTVALDGAAPGVYDIICDVPGHEDMVGTLEITG